MDRIRAVPLGEPRRRSGWTRLAPLAIAVASCLLPGCGQALRGRFGAMGFAIAASAIFVAGSVLAAYQGCTCGLIAGFGGYLGVGLLAAWWRERPGRRASRWGLLVLAVSIPVGAFLLVQAEVIGLYVVTSESMEPTLTRGDSMLVSQLGLRPRRGDLIVFHNGIGGLHVKRVIALPGDRISIERGRVWLNGKPQPLLIDRPSPRSLTARYYTETGEHHYHVLFERPWPVRPSLVERVVPRGHLFVMGDNRDRSDDSRHRGYVSFNDVVGIPFALGVGTTDAGALRWGRAGWLL